MQEVSSFEGRYVCTSLYDWGYLEDAALFVITRIEVDVHRSVVLFVVSVR